MKKILLLITVFIFSYGVVDAQTMALTFAESNVKSNGATLNGAADWDGSSDVDFYFAYRTAAYGSGPGAQPAGPWLYSTAIAPAGTSLTIYSYNLTGLVSSTDYEYYFLVWDNVNSIILYSGTNEPFTTLGSPTTSTTAIGTVAQTTAVLNAAGTTSGATLTTSFGYRVSPAGVFTYVSATPSTINGITVAFTSTLTGLTPGTTYDYISALFDASGINLIANSAVAQFTTSTATAPTVSTGTLGTITTSSVQVIVNNISDNGGVDISSYGLAYSTTTGGPYTEDEKGNSFTTPNNFNHYVSGLSSATHYYVVAYATNSVGTTYGSTEREFYTTPASRTNFTGLSGLTDTDHTILTLNWSNGDGDGRIIVAYVKGAAVTPPVDGATYTGNAAFGTPGSALGAGFVVYSGTGAASLGITNLDGDNSDYNFYAYEYAGAGGLINYKTLDPGFITTDYTTFPIELISFTAKNDNGNVLINWATASETDNDYFEIERSSDAENFEVIANVVGAGYSNEVLNYSIQDNAALDGTVYYRLKQTDFNGAFTYSYILPIKIGESNDLQISNIINADNSISFVYNNNDGGTTQIQLLDISGRIVKTQEVSGEGSQLVRIGMSGMSHGVYVLHITLDDQKIVKKVVF